MKRAPVIPKSMPVPTPSAPVTAPAAPMVDSLIARVGAMTKGNTVSLPVCGREVRFTLETLPADMVAARTQVWAGNERDQTLLTEDALDDLLPSFLLSGQQTPAFGRKIEDHIEVADGSRRRMAAIFTRNEYRILVGDLDDEQMNALCKLGNDYRPTSAYERGKRYAARLENEFSGNISALAEAENISRKIINRCLCTARLPREVIALFSHPGELSARAGESLFRLSSGKEDVLRQIAGELSDKKRGGVLFEADEILQLLSDVLKPSGRSAPSASTTKRFLPGASARYKGNNVIFNLDRSRLPEECIARIEDILEQFASNHKQ